MKQVINLHIFNFLWLKIPHTSLFGDMRSMITSVLVFLKFFFPICPVSLCCKLEVCGFYIGQLFVKVGYSTGESGWKIRTNVFLAPRNTIPIRQLKEAAVRSSAPNTGSAPCTGIPMNYDFSFCFIRVHICPISGKVKQSFTKESQSVS